MVKERSIAACIILSIITCGIYEIYWFICLTNDANTVSRTYGTSGITAFLLSVITCNIYGLYWAYKQGEKIDNAKQEHGIPSNNSGVLYLILYLIVPISIIALALMQNEINTLSNMDVTRRPYF